MQTLYGRPAPRKTQQLSEYDMEYFKKMKGTTKSPPTVSLSEIFWSWIGAFFGIGAVAFINYNIFKGTDLVMIIGSSAPPPC